MQTMEESGVARATFQIDYDDEVAFAAKRWLFNMACDKARGQNAPFALVASFIHPHNPYVTRSEWWNLYRDKDIDIPAYVPKAEDQDPFSKRLMDGIEVSYVPLSEEELRRARSVYLANVSYFERKIGKIERTLDEIDELENAILIVTADHGDMLGERGL